MSRNPALGGVIAAVLLPRDEEGRPRWDDFGHLVDFLSRHGIDGVCVNGATGEYVRASVEERRTAVAVARRAAPAWCPVIAGAGSASTDLTVRLAEEAEAAGAEALLIPPPHFFHYAADDIDAFYRAVAAAARRPILIYRLPAFVSDVHAATAEELIRECPRIAGVKDSSGQLDLLERLTANPSLNAHRFVGNDNVLVDALRRGLCDGVISGVACVLPELITAIWDAGRRRDAAALDELGGLLSEAIQWIDSLPAPMGLELLAGIRGLCRCLPAVPLSPRRQQQAEAMRRWFEPWWESFAARFSSAARPSA
ncbi:MAG: dihydrodipicolinate synthase family protein [Bryobacteraceae bacterium]